MGVCRLVEPNYLSQEGLEKLQEELEQLKTVRRHELTEQMHLSREMGGTGGEADFEEVKDELAFVEGRILTLEKLISDAVIIHKDPKSKDTVQLGSRVTVKNEAGKQARYTITGSAEADPTQGKVSNISPIGQALLGKKVGEIAEVEAPAGTTKLEIVSVR